MRISMLLAAAFFMMFYNKTWAQDERVKSVLITDVRIVSAALEKPSGLMDILIVEGKIEAIASDLSNHKTKACKIIDGAGRFLAPGLIDGHTHLAEIPGMRFDQEQKNPEIAEAARTQIPKSYLYHGFTTVIDLNGSADYIDSWNSRVDRPQAYFCGASPVFDGYPMSWMQKPDRYRIMPYFLYDKTRAAQFPDGFDPANHSPEAVVERMKSDGAICVKTHFEPGFGGQKNLPVPTVELIQELKKTAHAHGMPLLLHANTELAQTFGVDAGVDAVVHGPWTWEDNTQATLSASMRSLMDRMSEQGIAMQPTFQVLYGERDLHDPTYLSRPDLKRVVPQDLLQWYGAHEGQWWRRRMLGIPLFKSLVDAGRWQEIDREALARVKAAYHYFVETEGPLIFGSDTPSDPSYANPAGLNGRLEFNNLLAAGASAGQIFRAATISNAEFFGLADSIGSVEVGKRADLLLLGENPLEDVTAYDSIELVIVKGKIYSRTELAAGGVSEQNID